MKSPAFQFYPKDWRGNLKLRRCSEAARGAWVDIICVLHDSEEYGVARFALSELASVAGVKLKSARELVDKGVLKGADGEVPAFAYTPRHAGKALPTVTLLDASVGPMWYSSRMVRDEWLRGRRGESTRFGPDNNPRKKRQGDSPTHRQGVDNTSPTHREGEPLGDGAAVASASAVPIPNTVSRNTSVASRAVDNPMGGSTSTPRAAAHSIAKAQAQIDEQRASAERAAPPPDDLMAPFRKAAG